MKYKQLEDKLKQEIKVYKQNMKKYSKEELIERLYKTYELETIMKIIISKEIKMNEEIISVLLEKEDVLQYLFDCWMKVDSNENAMLIDIINESI